MRLLQQRQLQKVHIQEISCSQQQQQQQSLLEADDEQQQQDEDEANFTLEEVCSWYPVVQASLKLTQRVNLPADVAGRQPDAPGFFSVLTRTPGMFRLPRSSVTWHMVPSPSKAVQPRSLARLNLHCLKWFPTSGKGRRPPPVTSCARALRFLGWWSAPCYAAQVQVAASAGGFCICSFGGFCICSFGSWRRCRHRFDFTGRAAQGCIECRWWSSLTYPSLWSFLS
ncbi:hypothetical protein OEZ85_002914 [Tetradesmus obliquus]|uniref:Uncharacterized protein n=1 Tax=Tetradesmus obliquus TaxID=3088 RepID=A0ABY8U367_TETOB|nr:hypothetical protein OEZ85_002914 [Tetradesmus obliquus]